MSLQFLLLAREDHQPFITAIMQAQRRPREEENRDPGRLASILYKIPSVRRFSLPSRGLQKQQSHPGAFKMNKISKSAIVPIDKQRSLPPSESATAGHSRSHSNQIGSNGHAPTTSQGIKSVGVEHSPHGDQSSTSVPNNCVSAIPVFPATVDATTARPPVVEETSRKHVKQMAHDCYVDLAHPLSPELERAWDNKTQPWLETNIPHSMEDANGISAELVMAGIKHDGLVFPTLLVMCRDLAQKESIEDILKRCTVIPKNVQRRIIISDILTSTSKTSITNPATERFLGRQIAIKFDDAHGANILYANVAEVLPVASDKLSVFCTIGGMLLVNGKPYGLTTAHPLATSGGEGQATPIVTSGIQFCVLFQA